MKRQNYNFSFNFVGIEDKKVFRKHSKQLFALVRQIRMYFWHQCKMNQDQMKNNYHFV